MNTNNEITITNENKRHIIKSFINQFEAIPDELWCVGRLGDKEKHCALGHLGVKYFGVTQSEKAKLFIKILNCNVPDLNDGFVSEYQQTTPKARILAALHDKLKECI